MTHDSTKQHLHRLERMVAALHRKMDSLMRSQNIEILMEYSQMADFKEMIDVVTRMEGRVASTNRFVRELEAKIAELAAGLNDTEDQAAVHALAAQVGALVDQLPQAIDANPGVSTGGIA